MNAPVYSATDARGVVVSILEDFWEDAKDDEGVDRLFDYWRHVGFRVEDLPPNPAPELVCEAFVGHYRVGGEINADKAMKDFATWPPISARIVELAAEKAAEARKTRPRQRKKPK